MKQILFKKLSYNITRITLSVLASVAVMTAAAYATSTIGTNFSADGTLSVTATSTLTSDLRVDTNTLVVDSFNDKVGIGTTTPNWKLSVSGIGSFDDYVRTSYFTATSTTASTFPYASTTALTVSGSTYLTNLGQGWLHTYGGTNALTSSTSPTVAYLTATSPTDTSTFAGGIAVETSGLVYDYSTNNVGIGTTNPGAKLEISGTSATGDFLAAMMLNTSAVTGSTTSLFLGKNNVRGVELQAVNMGGSNQYDMALLTSNPSAAPTEKMRITNSGNVGIGTTTPQKKLTVSNGAAATTTVELGDIYSGTGKTCFNVAQANGSVGSFYFANGAMVVENNTCR